MIDNKNTYNNPEVVREYSRANYLLQPERSILNNIISANTGKMLDIGIGAGRTTKYFAPLFKEYHGVDYSANMIEHCREKFASQKNIFLYQGDAQNLSAFPPNEFDFILFSFNGIDCVTIADREKVLAEVFRVGKNGARFAFSFHNMFNLPKLFLFQIPKNPLKWMKEFKRVKGVKNLNRPMAELMSNDSSEIIDGDADFNICNVYMKPQAQFRQLAGVGFNIIAVYDLSNGLERKPDSNWEKVTDAWIYLLCEIEK